MTTIRRCQDCHAPLSSNDSTHCPECGTALDDTHSASDSTTVDDIIKTVKEQIVSSDKHADAQLPGEDSGDGRDVSSLLSGSDFRDILGDSRNDKESPSTESPQISPEVPGEEHSSPFSTVLGSFKSSRSHSRAEPVLDDEPERTSAADAFDSVMVDEDSPAAEESAPDRPQQPDKPELKSRTWWSCTRQTLWLLFLLLVCIVFFRLFGPERKEPSIEDFFSSGNPDVEFLDAINFLEKYYERQRKQQELNASLQSDEVSFGDMQPGDWNQEKSSEQAPDNSTPRSPDAASSVFSDPMP